MAAVRFRESLGSLKDGMIRRIYASTSPVQGLSGMLYDQHGRKPCEHGPADTIIAILTRQWHQYGRPRAAPNKETIYDALRHRLRPTAAALTL